MVEFKKSLYAKCILSGEHAVLRGAPALVFPIKSYSIDMHFKPSEEYFDAVMSGPHGEPLKFLFWGLLEVALQKLGKSRRDLTGRLELVNYLPFGGGLGASAAISVGVGRLLRNFGLIADDQLFEFCRSLEDQFHGESSGADIAIAFYESAIKYIRHKPVEVFTPKWSPQLYLYYTGQKGVTLECVNKVKALQTTKPDLFARMDFQMKESVDMCERALSMDTQEGFEVLRAGLRLGQQCYEEWDLVTPEVDKAITLLTEGGAQQCKLTGSGGGGYLIGLWKEAPAPQLQKQLLPLSL